MITDTQVEEAKVRYYERGILKDEVRSYEVSLWTLLDEFITVLKWSDVEQKGRIQEPKMVLNVDGTENFSFVIPMYLQYWDENANYAAQMVLKENPIWYNTRNGNLIEGLRKIKVIFNKGSVADEKVFEFVIIKITEKHEQDMLTCEVECEGLAFHELGKIGYKINLSQDNFELTYEKWMNEGRLLGAAEPIQNVQYWCKESGLVAYPGTLAATDPNTWYYYIDMDYSSFAFAAGHERDNHKVYEEPYTSSWTDDLVPKQVQQYKEKARPVEANQSNLYNITLTIAELFGIHCRYAYTYDENYHIIAKIIVFYNNYNKENEGMLGLIYPYSAKNVLRNVDVTDLTTKLFIQSLETDSELLGEVTIMDSDANKTKEDYILNFDYMHKIGGITDEQYAAVAEFEKEIRAINGQLIPVLNELNSLEGRKVEAEAKQTLYKNAMATDKEQKEYNAGLAGMLDALDTEEDGFIHITEARPDTAIIIKTDDNRYYINLNNTKKGIVPETIQIFRTWLAGQKKCDPATEVTGFELEYENGNVSKIWKVPYGANDTKTVYLTYKYKPLLYYDNIIKTWDTRLADDTAKYNEATTEVESFENLITKDKALVESLIASKDAAIAAFERMMGPALREGYWTPEDYSDRGELRSVTLTFPATSLNCKFTNNAYTEDVMIDWDNVLFDDEDKIYYEVGNNLNQTYYPCLNLASIFESNPNNIRANIDKYSFIFNTNYNDDTADKNNTKYIRSFSVGSEALLKFVKNSAGTVFPVLVLVGAKTMSDTTEHGAINEIAFMKSQSQGHPRLGIINTTINSTDVSTVVTNAIEVHDASYWSFGGSNISNCTQVCPRIKFNNINAKVDTTNLKLVYNTSLLTPYTHYSMVTRLTKYGTNENPDDKLQYYVTLRPEVLWKCGTYTGNLDVYYVVSSIATSIYVDALEISKKNAEPKVEYNLEANILDENLIRTLYKNLARIVLINDADLKLEDAYGYISNIEMDLDRPENDTIEIKNYTSKFEDLFSAIVASTEAMLRAEGSINSTIGGNTALSASGFYQTILDNDGIMLLYLDDYFTTSPTVLEVLASLFNEAGTILGNSNKVLSLISSISEENASILGGFASLVISELSPRVTKDTTQPTDFKVGDIFILVDEHGEEIGRYVATADSLHSADGYGFTRTYDGSLAQITGAKLDIDAENGKLSLRAANRLEMLSGGTLYIAANENVDIVGNKSVNIGGTKINIGTTSIDNTPYTGGVYIVATAYTNQNDFEHAYTSKVLIEPDEIYMAGSKITMLTGSTNAATNAIELDGSKGIWIGSDKKVSLYSGNDISKANVELSPAHILFGVQNSTNSNVGALEVTEEHVLLAAGNGLSSMSGGVTMSNDVAGVEITRSKIGLAVGSGGSRSAIVMDGTGLVIGTSATVNNTTVTAENNGSYVTINGGGVTIGSKGKLDIQTTNFLINSSAALNAATEMFRLGTENDYALLYKQGVLTIRGSIQVLENGSSSSLSDWVNAKITPTQIWLGVKRATDPNDSAHTEAASYLEITDSKIKIKSSGNFEVDAANIIINTDAGNGASIFKLTNGAVNNPINYLNIAKDNSGALIALLGGWTIITGRLYSGSSTNFVALDSGAHQTLAMWAGKESPDDVYTGERITTRGAPFRVTRTGRVYMDYLMLWDSDNQVYKEVDFSDFNLAVSLVLEWGGDSEGGGSSGGGSSTQTNSLACTATATYWGKFKTKKTISSSLAFDGCMVTSASPHDNTGYGWVQVSGGGTTFHLNNVLISAPSIYLNGFEDADGLYSLATITLLGEAKTTHVLGDGGWITPIGSSSVTVDGTTYYSAGLLIYRYKDGGMITYYEAGTEVSDTYYTKTPTGGGGLIVGPGQSN